MWSEHLIRNQINRICFVMVNANYTEVAGLGATVTAFISKNGGAFNAVTNAVAEIGNGWYTLLLTAAECDTIGPVAIYMPAVGTAIQQNTEYVVQQRNAGCLEFTYTVTNSVTLLPVEDADVWITTDLAGTHVIWHGLTDIAGIARDDDGNLPCLDGSPAIPRTYYFWKNEPGLIDDDNPDVEVVS